MTITIPGQPVTKKNSQQIIVVGGRTRIIPSKRYKEYREAALWAIPAAARQRMECPLNVQCVYFMENDRRVDLCNLIEATCDILVDAGVLKDDNRHIVASHDGSRVEIDRERPRVEITITEV